MHLKTGVPMITLLFLLFLSGCAPKGATAEQQAQEIRSLYQTMDSIHAVGTITADYADRIYTFGVEVEGSAESGTMTVTSPENIAGSVIQWTEDALALNVEDVHLELGELSESGFSPADAVPAILKACQGGLVTACSFEEKGEHRLLVVEYQNTDAESSVVRCAFSADTLTLCQAEIFEEGQRVITLDLDDISLTESTRPE